MKTQKLFPGAVLSLPLLLCLPLCSLGADWPQYRGATHDGISTDHIKQQWSGSVATPLWRVSLPSSLGSFSVSGGRAYTMIRRTVGGADKEVCVALNPATGAELWATAVEDAYYDSGTGGSDGPRSTPTVDGGSVYVLTSWLKLYRLDAATGVVIWERDLWGLYGGWIISWQAAASPVVEGGLIYVQAACGYESLMAINTSDGSLAWSAEYEDMTHSTPVLATINGVRQVIFATQSGLVSLDPLTGARLWKCYYPFYYTTSLAISPVVYQDMIFISGAYGMGSSVVKATLSGGVWSTTQLWNNNWSQMQNQWMTPVCYQGYIYGQFGTAVSSCYLECIDMRTGALKWATYNFGMGGTLLVDNHLLILTEYGDLVLAEPNPSAYTEVARFQAIPDYSAYNRCWNSPAVADGRVYVRSTSYGAVFDLSVNDTPPSLALTPPVLNFNAIQGVSPASQAFGVANSGGGTLNWTAVAGAPAWLTVSPSNGVNNATLTVSVASGSLAPGTYSNAIIVTAAGVTNSPQMVAVNLTVTTVPPNLAVSPTAMIFGVAQGNNPPSQMLGITNCGNGILTWTVMADASAPAWLSVNPTNGVGDGTVIVSARSAGFAPGFYTKNLAVTALGATNSPQTVVVNLTVFGNGTSHYDFTYPDRASLRADGWDFLARTASGGTRDTEQTNGAMVSYDQLAHPGVLRVPADLGDVWAGMNNTRNSLFRDLPTNWLSLRLKLSFSPTQSAQQAGLMAYQDDDNYVHLARGFDNGGVMTWSREVGRDAVVLNSLREPATNGLVLRLDRDVTNGTFSALYSLDATNWLAVGLASQTLNNPRLGIFVGGDFYPGGFPNADLAWAEVITPQAPSTLAVGPTSLDLGSIQAGACGSGTFYVTNLGGGTLTGSVSGATAPFSVLSGGSYSLGLNAWQAVVVQYCPTVPGSDNVNLTFTGGGGATRLVTASAYTAPDIVAGTTSLDLGAIQAGACASGTFYVTNLGGGTLTGSVSGATAPFSVVSGGSYSLGPNAWQAVVVQYCPTVPGSNGVNLTLTGGGGATQVLSGSAYPAPAIAVGPATLDLGCLQAGACASGTFYVTNLGDGTLTGSVSGATAPFSVLSGGSYSLGSNAWQAVIVQYSPTAPGSNSVNLTFTGGGGATLLVTGSAVPKPNLMLDPPWLSSVNTFGITIRTANGTPMDSNRLAGMELRASSDLALSPLLWPVLTNNFQLSNGVVLVPDVDAGPSSQYFIIVEP